MKQVRLKKTPFFLQGWLHADCFQICRLPNLVRQLHNLKIIAFTALCVYCNCQYYLTYNNVFNLCIQPSLEQLLVILVGIWYMHSTFTRTIANDISWYDILNVYVVKFMYESQVNDLIKSTASILIIPYKILKFHCFEKSNFFLPK